MRRKPLAMIAAAAASTVVGIAPKTQAQTVFYRPVVTLVGDGTATDDPTFTPANLLGATATVQVYNYGQTGAFLAENAYDSTTAGDPNLLVNTASSTTEATLTNNPMTADDATSGVQYPANTPSYVYSSGYAGTNQEAGINGATTAANRVVGYMSITGNTVSSGTVGLTETNALYYSNDNIRGAVGDDTPSDGNFWTAGTGSGHSGFRFANNTTSTNNALSSSATVLNTRQMQIREGQLYGGSSSFQNVGISIIGDNPTPSTLSTLPTSLSSPEDLVLFETGASSAESPEAFVLMKDPNNSNLPTTATNPVTESSASLSPGEVPFNVAYIADVGTTSPGIQKWVFTGVGSNNGWNLQYTIPDAINATGGDYGLAAELVTNPSNSALDNVDLFTTNDSTTGGDQNYLEQFTDPLEATSDATTTEVTLARAPANEGFRGVALAPIVPIAATWNSAANATWSTGADWTGSNLIPGTFGDLADTAVFGTTGGGPTTNVTLDTNRTVGHVTFNSSSTSYTISASGGSTLTINDTGDQSVAGPSITVQAGSHTISAPISLANGVNVNTSAGTSVALSGNISGSGGFTSSGSGSVSLSGSNSYTGGTTVTGGNLFINAAAALPNTSAVSITNGGTMHLADNITAGTPLATSNVNIPSLSITGNSTLDIGNNRIIVDYTPGNDPIASIEAWIKNGYSDATGHPVAGPAIISSDIAADDSASGYSYGIGYADASDLGNPISLAPGTIEIMFTLLGDANLDGTVNGEDFSPFSSNLGGSPRVWDQGDFNYDGTVNGEDFALFSHNAGQTDTAYAAATGPLELANGISLANVPEPGSIGLLTAGALGLMARRRRRRL
jgi:autotransporter-associated beta strand protein